MMVAVFLTMLLAFSFAWFGRRVPALLSAGLCLGLSVWLFLFEVYSQQYGFRMPWIDTRLDLAVPPGTVVERGA